MARNSTTFAVSIVIEHDQEASTVTIVALAAESRFPTNWITLRPEHNNPVDALRIIMNPDIGDQYDYDEWVQHGN